MKFGDRDLIPCQKLYQGIIITFDYVINMAFYDVILYFMLCSGRKKVENRNFFVFHPICLKFCIGDNFEMLIINRRPELTLENDLGKKN